MSSYKIVKNAVRLCLTAFFCLYAMTARGINKLTALQVKKAKPNPDKMYKLPDGGNLYLRIDSSGSKYWIFNYTRPYISKRNDLSLCTYPEVTLEEARTVRDDLRG